MKLIEKRWLWQFEFKFQDFWIGAFWKRDLNLDGTCRVFNLWICLVPCFPLHIGWVGVFEV